MNGDHKGGGKNSFRDGDPRVIDLGNREERAYWCKVLGVADRELDAAVAAVGSSAHEVKRWLAARRRPDGD